MIVITGWVGKDTVEHSLVHFALYLVEVGTLIECLLLGIGQAVETHVLQGTASARGGKGISHRALGWNLTPLGVSKAIASIHRHTALIKLLAVSQNVLAHLAQVDVEIATIVGGIGLLTRVDEWVEHPKLDVFDVGLLEVVSIQFSHHTAPHVLWIAKRTIRLEVGNIEVVWSWLRWIIGEVEHAQGIGSSLIGALLAQWEKFLGVDFAHIVIAELLQVALDMARSQRTTSASEQWVDAIPGKTRAMETAGQASLVVVVALEVERWHTGDNPRGRGHHVDGILGVLEVVDIGGVVLGTTSLTSYQLGELSRKGDLRWLSNMQERNLVEHVGQPLALFLPVQIEAQESVLQWFRSHRHLVGEGLLGEMLQGTTYLEILGEVIFPVDSHHRLSHLSIVGVAFQGYVDGGSGVDDALVEDGYLASIVIHRVVASLLEGHATGGYHHRPLRHIIGTQGYDVG